MRLSKTTDERARAASDLARPSRNGTERLTSMLQHLPQRPVD